MSYNGDEEEAEQQEEPSPYSLTDKDLIDRELHAYGRLSTQLYTGAVACLSAISFGNMIGWSTFNLYIPDDEKSDQWKESKTFGWIIGLMPLGCSLGILPWVYFMAKVGPKKAMQVQAFFYIVNWWLSMEHRDHQKMAVIGRLLMGMLGISYLMCGEVLLHETIHKKLLQYFSVAFQCSIITGVVMSYISQAALTHKRFTLLCTTIPTIHFVLLFTLPESPVFLFSGSEKLAEDALIWYRGKGNLSTSMRPIRKLCEFRRVDPETYKYMLFTKAVMKPFLIVACITVFQVFSGYYIILFYGMEIWNHEKPVISTLMDTVLIGSVLFISKLFWGLLRIRYDWRLRKILLWSCIMVAIQLTLLSVYLVLLEYKVSHTLKKRWVAFLFVGLLIFFCDMSLNNTAKVLIFRYTPYQVCTLANSIISIISWFLIFVNVYSFACLMQHDVPSFYVFGSMAILLYIASLFVYFCVVETKGRSLIQIQKKVGGNPVGHRAQFYSTTVNTMKI